MITNLVATITVCLVTNVTEHFPTHLENDNDWWRNHPQDNPCWAVAHLKKVPDENPKVKVIQTDVVERTVLKFDWNGPKCVTNDVVKITTSQAFELRSGWEQTTNMPVLDGGFMNMGPQ